MGGQKSEPINQTTEPNQSEPNQSKPNQSKPNQSKPISDKTPDNRQVCWIFPFLLSAPYLCAPYLYAYLRTDASV